MKLEEACEYTEACGLGTVGEAVLNIMIHATNLFTYEKANGELNELVKDAAGILDDMPIGEILMAG